MRRVEVLNQLHLQFPNRNGEFDLGLEIGAITVLMALGEPSIRRSLSMDCIDQLRPIAARFGYAVTATPADDTGLWDTALEHRRSGRPRLRIV